MIEYSPERISPDAQKDRPIKQEKLYRRHGCSLCQRRESRRKLLSESLRISKARHYERPRWQARARRIDDARHYAHARPGNARNGRSQRTKRRCLADDTERIFLVE